MEKRLIIAIDGPAASGKSTTAQRLAKMLGYVYLDTGAMYRACALQAQRKGVDLSDAAAVSAMLDKLDISIEPSENANLIRLDGEDVSQAIRANDISALASQISALPAVRYRMVELQRKLGADGGVILDGRDIGTFVFPQADYKFYLTASPEVRAERRWLELRKKGIEKDLDSVLAELNERDRNDAGRDLAPLAEAPDAIRIDTSSMSLDEQAETLYRIINPAARNRPEIRLAEHSGFCFGVQRAIRLAEEARTTGAEVCTYGELIHNPRVVEELAESGISSCDEIDKIHNKTVVIRSHGISRQELEALQAGDNKIIDATCPYVRRAQELVASLHEFPVIIMGDPEHPEVRGMLSYGNAQTQVLRPDEALPDQNWKTVCVISQTTQKLSSLQDLVGRLLPRALELRVFNTICSATSLRQAAAVALAHESDLMIVIGGKKSSNTRMLQDLCAQVTRSVHIEDETEITPEILAGAKQIGLSAGASTPAETIVKVFNKIKKINGEADTATWIGELPLFKEESC